MTTPRKPRTAQGFVSLGTSGVVFVSTDRFPPNPAQAMHAFCHALPGRWHQIWLADGGRMAEVCTLPQPRRRFDPAAADLAGHAARHARFQALYRALRDQF